MNDKVIIEITSDSAIGSITQGNANSKKLDAFVDSITAYIG